MNIKILAGTTLAVALVGFGSIAGSVIGNVGAQTPPTDATTPNAAVPDATNPTVPSTNPSTDLPEDMIFEGPGMHGGMGMDGFVMDDFGMDMDGFGMGDFVVEARQGEFGKGMKGMKGMTATADGANAVITKAANLITLAKEDLAYATGKMDVANIQRWLNSTDSLVKSAQTASQNTRYEQAVNYARAAMELAMTAESQMGKALGFDKLPSYAKRPQMPHKGDMATVAEVTQAQASRILARTYERLVMQAAALKGNSEAAPYLTEAQNAYKTAYDAYTASKYSVAVGSAHLASQLANVAHRVYEAVNAPSSTDGPVTVPQPNF